MTESRDTVARKPLSTGINTWRRGGETEKDNTIYWLRGWEGLGRKGDLHDRDRREKNEKHNH